MYLLLQADQRLKQNQEDLALLAHLQELYLFVKEYGLILNQELDTHTEAESEMSLESRSFLHRVNDQVRKRQNQSSKDATKDSDKHSVIWRMFMSSTLQSLFMGKNDSDNWHSIKITEDLTLKQMFDISEKLITEQSDEIYRVKTISWENS